MTTAAWRIVLLASLGGTLEFYDFVIFGIFAKDSATFGLGLVPSFATWGPAASVLMGERKPSDSARRIVRCSPA